MSYCDSIIDTSSIPDNISEGSSGDLKSIKASKSQIFDMENPVVYRRPPRRGDDSASNIFGGPINAYNTAKINPRITKSQVFNADPSEHGYDFKRKSHAQGNLFAETNGTTNGHDEAITKTEVNGHNKSPDPIPHATEQCESAVNSEDGRGSVDCTEVEDDKDCLQRDEENNHEEVGQGDMVDTTGAKPKHYIWRGGLDSEENYKRNQRGMYNPITGESYD